MKVCETSSQKKMHCIVAIPIWILAATSVAEGCVPLLDDLDSKYIRI